MEGSNHIHFFSWGTRISLELPAGFEEQIEDPDNSAAIYADDLEEGEEPGARVMAKMTAAPSAATDAYRSLASASAQIGTRELEHREEGGLDGAPAVRQILRYRDEEAGMDVLRHETYAQLDNVVFSVTCLAPSNRSADYAAAFEHASRSARIVLPGSGPGGPLSFAHSGVRVSAIIPGGWTATEPSEYTVRFFAPPDPDHDGSIPTFSIALGEPDGFGPDGFSDFCEASIERLGQEIPEFVLRSVERYTLSSFVDVHAVWYTGVWESERRLVQLQALGLLDRYHLFLINAAAPLASAERYSPLFDAVLRSLRALPSRPDAS
ncbi:MAG: hypothetical protein ACOCW6_00555 [Spirochaetota bacterium]